MNSGVLRLLNNQTLTYVTNASIVTSLLAASPALTLLGWSISSTALGGAITGIGMAGSLYTGWTAASIQSEFEEIAENLEKTQDPICEKMQDAARQNKVSVIAHVRANNTIVVHVYEDNNSTNSYRLEFDTMEEFITFVADKVGMQAFSSLDDLYKRIEEKIYEIRVSSNDKYKQKKCSHREKYLKIPDTEFFVVMTYLYGLEKHIHGEKIRLLEKEIDLRKVEEEK